MQERSVENGDQSFFSAGKTSFENLRNAKTRSSASVKPKHAFALVLALKKFLPGLCDIDFLPESERIALRKAREKNRVVSMILFLGALFLTIIVLLNIALHRKNDRLHELEARILAAGNVVAAQERLQTESLKLAKALNEMQALVHHRSRFAAVMQEIAASIPARVWLEDIEIKLAKNRHAHIKTITLDLRGWAPDERDLAQLLKNLEASPGFDEIALMATRRLSPEEVFKRSKLRKTRLMHFTIKTGVVAP
mgnify:CR=1 FL=1